jgi:hypothetical protein
MRWCWMPPTAPYHARWLRQEEEEGRACRSGFASIQQTGGGSFPRRVEGCESERRISTYRRDAASAMARPRRPPRWPRTASWWLRLLPRPRPP